MQLAAVVFALGLATLTFLIPLADVALLMAAVRTFADGAVTLRLAHGLDPEAFSASLYLATLLLLGTGGWPLVSDGSRLAGRAEPPQGVF